MAFDFLKGFGGWGGQQDTANMVQQSPLNYTPTGYESVLSKLPKVRGTAPIGLGSPAAGPGWAGKAFGYKRADGTEVGGWAMPALVGAGVLKDGFMGMKQYGLAKDTFRQGKKEYEQNYDAQRRLTNAELEDRQRTRVASSPGHYLSVGDYMNKFGVK